MSVQEMRMRFFKVPLCSLVRTAFSFAAVAGLIPRVPVSSQTEKTESQTDQSVIHALYVACRPSLDHHVHVHPVLYGFLSGKLQHDQPFLF